MKQPHSSGVTQPHIRRAVAEDRMSLLAIVADSPSAPQWTAAEFTAIIEQPRDKPDTPLDRLILVIENSGAVAGFAVYTLLRAVFPPDAELESLAVSKSQRRRGFGAKLLDAVHAAVRSAGAEELALEVRVGNAEALDLYRKAGFQPTGIRRSYYASPLEDAVLMRLPFPEAELPQLNDPLA